MKKINQQTGNALIWLSVFISWTVFTSDFLESYPKRDVQSRQSTGQNFLTHNQVVDKRGLYVGIICMFIILLCMLLMPACTVVSDKQYKELVESNSQVYTKTEINNCYGALLHRIWIDNPTYVEDVLSETDEWQEYLKAIDGDTEDIFFFWSDEDSLNYNLAKEIEEENAEIILRHRARQTQPDTPLEQRYVR